MIFISGVIDLFLAFIDRHDFYKRLITVGFLKVNFSPFFHIMKKKIVGMIYSPRKTCVIAPSQ